jgi:DNA methylase
LRPDEREQNPLSSCWIDIPPLNSQADERLGYPTQKPLALLERIISASSNEGDVVLDPFCGCGTAVHAAQKLKRRWIGIDVTHLAVGLIERRLKDAFPGIAFEVIGTPRDIGAAREQAERDKHQFQLWACGLVNAQPYQGGRKGADRGIDGLLYIEGDRAGQGRLTRHAGPHRHAEGRCRSREGRHRPVRHAGRAEARDGQEGGCRRALREPLPRRGAENSESRCGGGRRSE